MCGLNDLKFGWSRGGVVAGQRSPSFEEDWIAYDRLPEAQKVNLPEKTGLSLEFFETEFGEIDGKQFKVVFSNFLGPCHHQVLCKGPVVDDKVHDFFGSDCISSLRTSKTQGALRVTTALTIRTNSPLPSAFMLTY